MVLGVCIHAHSGCAQVPPVARCWRSRRLAKHPHLGREIIPLGSCQYFLLLPFLLQRLTKTKNRMLQPKPRARVSLPGRSNEKRTRKKFGRHLPSRVVLRVGGRDSAPSGAAPLRCTVLLVAFVTRANNATFQKVQIQETKKRKTIDYLDRIKVE